VPNDPVVSEQQDAIRPFKNDQQLSLSCRSFKLPEGLIIAAKLDRVMRFSQNTFFFYKFFAIQNSANFRFIGDGYLRSSM